ncbi:uncharacterized protein LOC124278973 [Haliotis rubra]|uniref:uncharacterized protein LOC124278973 n=1 Tax=Haliotis rubra TaxID=36100 RepID=UPI001EE5B891|nr:uncharacterized protein LOC124278973 [Haliotis rubra]
MCLWPCRYWPCLCIIEFLSYLCLVTVPLYGAFTGIDVILRFSLLLYIHSVIVEYIPRSLFSVVPYLQLGLLVLLAFLPINLTPWPIVWLYDKLIWATEPLLLLAEVVLVQNFVMRCSQRVAEKIEDEGEEEGFRWKCLVIGISMLCYAVAVSLLWNIYSEGSSVQLWLVFVVLLLLVAVHNMMWMSQEADAAFCSLCTDCPVVVLYAMLEETSHIRAPLQPPPSWNRYYSKSLADIFISILNMRADTAMKAVLFFKKFLSPFFLLSVIIRLYCILFIVDKVTKNFTQGDENNVTLLDDIDADESIMSMSPWKSPLILRLSVIYMFTQLTTIFLSECSGGFLSGLSWLVGQHSIWPTQILLGRMFQVAAVSGFYMWRLYCADDWTWSEWLTP